MAYQPNPKQALFVWTLVCSPAGGVMQSKTRPELTLAERRQLIDAGFLHVEQRGRARYLTPTERAWSWAETAGAVALAKSPVGAEVLEALLRRLVPFLTKRQISLAELLPVAPEAEDAAETGIPAVEGNLERRIERECLSLATGKRKTRVRLSALRRQLSDVDRPELDRSLLELQEARRLVLYRDDDTAALTEEDRRAALTINDEPRHLVMLEAVR